jgi:membrane protease YdiL (CAAX protease family)
MNVNILNKYNNSIIIVLSSIVIGFAAGTATDILIDKTQYFNESLYFAGYVPSIMAMVAVLIYLCYRVGTGNLVFKIGLNTIVGVLGGVLVSWCFLRVIIKYFPVNPVYDEFTKMDLPKFIVGVASIGLIGPVLEEVILRGYVFQSVQNHYGTLLAWIISVLLSMVVHLIGVDNLSILYIIYLFVGIVLITASYQIGKIPSSIVVHVFMNIYICLY